MSTTATAAPFRFFDSRVVRTRRLGPSTIRITFGGDSLAGFAAGGRDQRFKLFLPHPHQYSPVIPTDAGEDWFARWRAMDPAVRAVMRSYTVREQRRDPGELDVDFALHGDGGPASRWAARAVPGDPVVLLGPVEPDNGGVDFRPPPGTDWVLLTGDETALPAVAGILAWLPVTARARVWIEVPHAADVQDLPTRAEAEITWLVREDAHAETIVDAVRAAAFPPGAPYAWIAGEAGGVRALRRHLVGERGFDRRAVTFTGYWRRGVTEEDLLAEAVAGTAAADD
ncbi:siderophore-interacting protein [Actinoallomurus rhizosphaericola]|uniref:siderophore-interacting protein n=1 Tax=Actinoallomurus rhizosphaericola TaxID=2952536 RepID=UPI0020933C36|nr:siderophore-interacting protein [Actinoallomurus rhizosphaericola]MCO5999738.1 siderophore-interacting protein [Actinoallomurus rhizosphaericola]